MKCLNCIHWEETQQSELHGICQKAMQAREIDTDTKLPQTQGLIVTHYEFWCKNFAPISPKKEAE